MVEHRIQRYVIGVLIHRKYARFRDLRPPATDTNLFSYHLKALMKIGLVDKRDAGYTLSDAGLGYVDRVSIKKLTLRSQPKIITMHVLTNASGQILLQRREKQPYIDTWTLPYGKTHINDQTIAAAAVRELAEKLGLEDAAPGHAGDIYIRVSTPEHHLSTTLAHVFTARVEREPSETIQWVDPESLHTLPLAPAVETIVRAAQGALPFFHEIDETWQ